MYCSLVSDPTQSVGQCGGCVLTWKFSVDFFFFVLLADVSPGYACWCWKTGQWDELEEEKLEEIFVICWEWGEKGKGDHRLQRWAQD